MKISEPGVRIIARILLTAVHRAQPHNAVPLIDPGRTTEGPDTQAINHRLDDGENPLLPLRRHRSDTTQLVQPSTLNVAHADVQTQYLWALVSWSFQHVAELIPTAGIVRGPRRPSCCGIDLPLADGMTRRRRAARGSRPGWPRLAYGTGRAVRRTDLRGARIGSLHAVTASRASGRGSSNRGKRLRGRLLLPLLDLRQVALETLASRASVFLDTSASSRWACGYLPGSASWPGELGHGGSAGSVAIGVGYAQRHRAGGRKGAHLPGGWVNRSAMTHRAAGWLPMPKWLA